MRQTTSVLISFLALLLIASACGPAGVTPTPPDVLPELPDPVETAVLTEVSQSGGLPVDELEVIYVEPIEWPDPCLGLAEEDEACAQVITPGWRVTVQAGEETYVVHTNEDGTTLRVE